MKSWPLLLAPVLLLACVDPDGLPTPRYRAIRLTNAGLCSSTVLLDGADEVWTESGCEARSTGWAKLHDASPDQRARVEEAFGALPAPGACEPDGGSEWNEFTALRREDETGDARWTVCELPDGGPAPEYVEATDALNALRR